VEYIVRRGDSLFSIARATGSTIDALQAANCLENIDRITVGERLYVPGPSSGPAPSDAETMSPQGCSDVGTVIISPAPGDLVRNVFILKGTALDDQFAYYQIDVRPDSTATYSFYSRSEQPVVDGTLGTIDPGIFSPGVYWIRLSVVDTSNHAVAPTCAIPMIFE
jgi:LysM repeat protein